MSNAEQPSFAVLVAVGPGDREVERLGDLVAALGHYEPARATLVMVDDCPEPRPLDRLAAPSGLRLVSVHHRRDRQARVFSKGVGICSVVMTGLRWIERNLDPEFVLKLDTDSLVIAPFSDRLTSLFERHPTVGMIGAYARSPGGGQRDWSPHAPPIRTLSRHPLLRAVLRRPAPAPRAAMRHVRALVRTARRHGYTAGEHCLGGGYAIGSNALHAIAAAGWLETAHLWATIDLPEDVMVGMHVRAAGYGFLDNVDDGGVFGVRHIGLPFPPQELARRGYAVIHAVKNDEQPEDEIRAFYAQRRLEDYQPA